MKTTGIVLAALFAVFGIACNVIDLEDSPLFSVDPTPGSPVEVADEPLTIKDADRELKAATDAFVRWQTWRNADIADEKNKVAFVEGFAEGMAPFVGEQIAAVAGPFAPLATLLIGYATKRRKDRSPDEVMKEKEDSYNAGLEAGRKLAAGIKNA